jgi:hypothetical protein
VKRPDELPPSPTLLKALTPTEAATADPAGCIVLAFPRAISCLVLAPADALKLATYLIDRATELHPADPRPPE